MNYVCFECRKSAKSPGACRVCGQSMICMGERFKVPPASDKKEWRKLRENHEFNMEVAEARRARASVVEQRLLNQHERRNEIARRQAAAKAKKKSMQAPAARRTFLLPIIPHTEEI